MFRGIASSLLVLTLAGCAVSPPTDMFSGFAPDVEPVQAPQKRVATTSIAQNEQKGKEEESGIGGSIGNLWSSVKTGLGVEGEESTIKTTVPANAPIIQLNVAEAQNLINTYRVQKGLKPLKVNTKLIAAAQAHSEDLAKSDRISHFGSDGSDHWQRIHRTGYSARLTAENVATGQRSVNDVIQGWEKSRDHNANLLLADAEEMGIAMVYKPDTQFKTFWTLVVGAKD
jgi:uncharacterized protein YkwD